MTATAITAAERAMLTARAAMASTAMALTLIAMKTWAAIHTSSMAMLGKCSKRA